MGCGSWCLFFSRNVASYKKMPSQCLATPLLPFLPCPHETLLAGPHCLWFKICCFKVSLYVSQIVEMYLALAIGEFDVRCVINKAWWSLILKLNLLKLLFRYFIKGGVCFLQIAKKRYLKVLSCCYPLEDCWKLKPNSELVASLRNIRKSPRASPKTPVTPKSPVSKRPLLASDSNRQRLAIFDNFRHCMHFWT